MGRGVSLLIGFAIGAAVGWVASSVAIAFIAEPTVQQQQLVIPATVVGGVVLLLIVNRNILNQRR
jgi:hypothetical protein